MSDRFRHIFETTAGWCGIAWGPAGVTGFVLPMRDRAAVENRLASKGGETTPVDAPRGDAALWVAAVRRYYDGEAAEFDDVAVDLSALDAFDRDILEAARRLAHGETTTYGELSNGGKCLVRASQICIGHKNDLGIMIAGTKGALKWSQEDPEKVTIFLQDQPDRTYWRGAVSANDGFLGDLPQWLLDEPTIPSGHGEAFHDAYARLHREFEKDVRAYQAGEAWSCDGSKYANIDDGRMGLAFIDAALKSDAADGAWEAVTKG